MDHLHRDAGDWPQTLLILYAKTKVNLQKEKKAIEEQVTATR